MEGCKRLIKGFWKGIRKQKKGDIPGSTGTEHTATNAWIGIVYIFYPSNVNGL